MICPLWWLRQKVSGSEQGLNRVSPSPGSVTMQPKAAFQNLAQGARPPGISVCLPDPSSPFPVGENRFPGRHSRSGSLPFPSPTLHPPPTLPQALGDPSYMEHGSIAGGATCSENTLRKHIPTPALRTYPQSLTKENCPFPGWVPPPPRSPQTAPPAQGPPGSRWIPQDGSLQMGHAGTLALGSCMQCLGL